MMKTTSIAILLTILCSVLLAAQENNADSTESGYVFTTATQLPATPVKNQYRTSTCWSFSSISLLESELMRMGRGEFDLSEMFVVRHVYRGKAEKYVRLHGKAQLAGGGAFNDVVKVLREYGMVPDAACPGIAYEEEKHVHGELDGVIKGYVDAVVKNRNGRLTPVWKQGLAGILDAYLGPYPSEFSWEGGRHSPRSFADEVLQLDPADYVLLSSYTHHPFYSQFVLEVPDNWDYGLVHNVPLDELMATLDYALNNGYTVAWASDVSEKGFDYRKGLAVLPAKDWDDMRKDERDSVFIMPVAQKTVTQELRQRAFDNYGTTDDHGMHIIGTATDQNGDPYYYVKNSWGVERSRYDGHFYASAAFVACKTMSIMLHRDAIPPALRQKLGL
ncbi:MAG: C1 family peptidase [Bacteroidota bacterium]|nr:C1 family peptidase [Bacteroidota bacterium]